jgi:ABC-type microcin C transport system permease subunit YejB
MQQVSSNLTLFLRLFLPSFWVVFFGSLTVAIFLIEASYFGNIPAFLFRIGLLVFFLLGVVVIYFTLFQLKRVEMGGEFVFATNYFKNYRYPWHNVEALRIRDTGLFTIGTVVLKTPGSFGKKIRFLMSRKRFENYLRQHPEIGALIPGEEV